MVRYGERGRMLTRVSIHPGDIPPGTLRQIERDLEPIFGKGLVAAMTYRVVVTREDDAWLGDVPGMQGAHTYSPTTLAMLDTYMREVTVDDDLPDQAMADLEFEWVLEMSDDDLVDALAQDRGVPRTEILARGWSLADVAAVLKAPVERVTHTPPPRTARVAR